MSRLMICAEDRPEAPERIERDGARIAGLLEPLGIGFERWPATASLRPGATGAEVLAAYEELIGAVMARGRFRAVDAVCVTPVHPERAALRRQFLEEHVHAEDEVRFFAGGVGQFYIHLAGWVYVLRCGRGDLIRVPAGVPHWFDMGEAPDFTLIRFFAGEQGWSARFTGDPIVERFPKLEPPTGTPPAAPPGRSAPRRPPGAPARPGAARR